jgi:hypothetical protein
MSVLFKDLSTNPYTQYNVHKWGAIYWLINFPLICCLFFFTPTLWLKLGIFITLIYSIYANLATDYGAMSAAEAALGGAQPPPMSPAARLQANGTTPDKLRQLGRAGCETSSLTWALHIGGGLLRVGCGSRTITPKRACSRLDSRYPAVGVAIGRWR